VAQHDEEMLSATPHVIPSYAEGSPKSQQNFRGIGGRGISTDFEVKEAVAREGPLTRREVSALRT